MQLRHVVTCFLVHPDAGTVLLGRRSDRVSTYPGRWAAISGSVETPEPLEQAYREIREEAGLERGQVTLLAEGRTVRFCDWQLATLWVVHPCLLRCADPGSVRCDWEHIEFQWLDPGKMAGLDTVPRLHEAWESARSAGTDPTAAALFDMIRRDRSHGAEELGLWTLEALGRAADEDADMKAVCRRAAVLRPSMAPVRSAALRVFELARTDEKGLALRVGRLIARREVESLGPAGAAADYMTEDARVVTLSYSFTVLAALHAWADRIAHLTVAESRPACEGRETARLAASFGIRTELVTDAAAFAAVGEADGVLLGADSLAEDGSVVNKTGSLALCCAAQRFGVDVTVLATENKVLPAGLAPAAEEMASEELGEPIPGVRAANPYFEVVPPDLVQQIVTGAGALDPERLGRLARELAALQDELKLSDARSGS